MSNSENFLISEAHLALDKARKEKAERLKNFGDPVELIGQALSIYIQNDIAWIAENTTVLRKLDLETGKTIKLLKGHTGPLASLASCPRRPGDGERDIIITGSWDKTIKLWDGATSALISTTPNAHLDFVKSLHVFPELGLLVSGGSDKVVRFWDISNPERTEPLKSAGSISSHTRPVECLDGHRISDNTVALYTGDTMGVIKEWTLTREDDGKSIRWTPTLKDTFNHHRTRINELRHGNGRLWTASADDTVQVVQISSSERTETPKPINHPVSVRAILPLDLTDLEEPYLITAAGDVLRSYDVSSLREPELLGEIEAHWHEITSIHLWKRKVKSDTQILIEPWVVTSSLDKTIRKWKLSYLLNPPPAPKAPIPKPDQSFLLSVEEERELDELMEED